MRRYWWVNHKQTSKQELSEGFLWSPKHNQNGSFSQYYENMRETRPGDYVFSFANAQIAHLGTVTGRAETRPKPITFGKAGEYWANEGWQVPIAWRKLRTPVSPKTLIDELRPFLPQKYSPLKPDGGGNQVYLTEISAPLFEILMGYAGVDLDLALAVPELASIFGDDLSEVIDEAIERHISISPELTATEISQLVKARRGQGQFRTNVQRIEKSCRLTGITSPYLLIASHIKPWHACETSTERLDGSNGLLLTPHVDHLFDRGLLSFRDDGTVLTSAKIETDDLHRMGIDLSLCLPRAFNQQQRGYLAYHRASVFI